MIFFVLYTVSSFIVITAFVILAVDIRYLLLHIFNDDLYLSMTIGSLLVVMIIIDRYG